MPPGTPNRGFYLVLKTALSSRHLLRCILTGEGGTSPLRFDKIFGRVKKAGYLQAVCPKVKFRPPFQRRQNPKTASLVAPRTERNLFLYISAGGEQKYSGGIFLCGEPSPGVPRRVPTRGESRRQRDFILMLSARQRLCANSFIGAAKIPPLQVYICFISFYNLSSCLLSARVAPTFGRAPKLTKQQTFFPHAPCVGTHHALKIRYS